jgi:hypothetical protein
MSEQNQENFKKTVQCLVDYNTAEKEYRNAQSRASSIKVQEAYGKFLVHFEQLPKEEFDLIQLLHMQSL